MSYGEQVLWAQRVLDNPEAAREALAMVKNFQSDFEDVYKGYLPEEPAARRFYEEMIANTLSDFAFSIRRD